MIWLIADDLIMQKMENNKRMSITKKGFHILILTVEIISPALDWKPT